MSTESSASGLEPQLFFSRKKREVQRKKSYSDFIMDLLRSGLVRAQQQRRITKEQQRVVQGGLFTLFFVRVVGPRDRRS